MAGSSNFLQVDINQQNLMSDVNFNGNQVQLNGVPLAGIADPLVHNKMYYQWSTFIYAFSQVFANLGYTVSDSNAAALQLVLANIITTQGGSFTGALNETSASITSAATTAIGAANANFITITGTTTITAFDSIQAGTRRIVEFAGALILTYNATSLILPGGSNITTSAGDTAIFMSLGSGNWICISYNKSNGRAITDQILTAGNGISIVGSTINATNYVTSQSLTQNGFIHLSNGLIQQWGAASIAPSGTHINTLTVTFPTAFSSSVFNITVTPIMSDFGGNSTEISSGYSGVTTSNFTAFFDHNGVNFGNTMNFVWSAIGI